MIKINKAICGAAGALLLVHGMRPGGAGRRRGDLQAEVHALPRGGWQREQCDGEEIEYSGFAFGGRAEAYRTRN